MYDYKVLIDNYIIFDPVWKAKYHFIPWKSKGGSSPAEDLHGG